MNIKRILCLGLLGFSASTMAMPMTLDYLHGLYVGVGAAENIFSFDNTYSFNSNVVDHTSFYNRSSNFTASNLNPDLVLGYGFNAYHYYYFGIEANANFNTIRRSNNDKIAATNNFTLNTTYDLFGKIGYHFLPTTMGYALFGGALTQLKQNVVFNADGPFGPVDLAPNSQAKTVWGGVVGVGIEQAYTDHLSFAAEYSHVFYSDTTYSLQHDIFKFLGNIAKDKVALSQDTVMLKAIYYI